jgi:hypothetical protein
MTLLQIFYTDFNFFCHYKLSQHPLQSGTSVWIHSNFQLEVVLTSVINNTTEWHPLKTNPTFIPTEYLSKIRQMKLLKTI